jgi:hypothetical protein
MNDNIKINRAYRSLYRLEILKDGPEILRLHEIKLYNECLNDLSPDEMIYFIKNALENIKKLKEQSKTEEIPLFIISELSKQNLFFSELFLKTKIVEYFTLSESSCREKLQYYVNLMLESGELIFELGGRLQLSPIDEIDTLYV